ncbi:TPA: DNA topoisomerase III [Providencia alcalifaciens]
MRVFIAEKPSLAKAIFEGLGGNPNTEKKNGYYQHGNDVVTWCVGHMLELNDPQDYDPKYANWRMSDLPIKTFFPPTYKIKEATAAQTKIILALIDQAKTIVNAGDPDEEGNLLVNELLDYAKNTKPVERVLISDLNPAPVKKALADLQPNEKFRGMSNSALSRSLLDQSFGYNLTRACTLKGREKGYQGVLNVGRVQSAVLGLVNMRTLANLNHNESFYYDVYANIQVNGHQVKAKYQTTDDDQIDEKRRLISEAQAKHITETVLGSDAKVTISTTKTESIKPPLPLNLSTLQILCAKRFGYEAQETLDIMQSLYETHNLLTYPRTDNRYLSDEHYYQASDIAKAVSGTMPEFASIVELMDKEIKHKAFNASKIEAHHAIVPTTKDGSGIKLTEKERNIYRLVATYYIGLFYPDALRDKIKVHFDIKGNTFTATQSVLIQSGWESLGKDSDEEETEEPEKLDFDLSTLKFNDNGVCELANVDKKPTLPPKYFTSSSLLSAMVKAAKFIDDPVLRKALEAKDEGSTDQGSIGTEATRAGILKKLSENTGLISIEKEKGYSELVWKTTKQGQEFCAALPAEITKPDISAQWAEKQALIKKGELTVADFIKETDDYIKGLIAELDANGINITANGTPCPVCQKGFLIKRKGQNGFFWGCSCYPECKTAFPDKNGQPVMEKQPNEGAAARLNVVCPSCSKEILIRPKGYFCTGCEFKIWGEFCSKKLTQNQVEKLIKDGKTTVIKGFKIKAGKTFDAELILDDKKTGKIGFPGKKK